MSILNEKENRWLMNDNICLQIQTLLTVVDNFATGFPNRTVTIESHDY